MLEIELQNDEELSTGGGSKPPVVHLKDPRYEDYSLCEVVLKKGPPSTAANRCEECFAIATYGRFSP